MSPIEGLFALLAGGVVLMALVLFVICRPAPRRRGDSGTAGIDGYGAEMGHAGQSGHSDHSCVSHDGGFSDGCSSGGGHF
jgi:hypothetical protein